MKKKKKLRKRWIVLIVIVIIAVAAILNFAKMKKNTIAMNGNWSTQEVTRGDIQIITEGNGVIEAADEITVVSNYALKVDTVNVENGDVVEKGDAIARVDVDSIEEQIEALTTQLDELNSAISNADKSGASSVTAPVSGRVKRIFVKTEEVLEDVLREHGGMRELSIDGKLKVEFTSSEKLSMGDEVTVAFLNYEEDGIVVSADNGNYTVTIEDASDYYVDTEVNILDENETVIGTGYLESNHPYLVDARYGIADEIYVSVGEYVNSGETLLTRTEYDYNQSYLELIDDREELMEKLQELRKLESNPAICAENSGIISELALQEDAVITEDAVMYHMISTDTFWLKTDIDELDIAGVEAGQTATVVFDAFEEESYEGKVIKVSALGKNTGGVTKYQVTIEVPGVEKAKMAMSATATIIIEEKENVLLIPVDAISNVDGQKCVTVLRNNVQETVPVTLGLVNNTMAEVQEGLAEGDQILIEGKNQMEEMMSMIQKQRASMLQGQGGEN